MTYNKRYWSYMRAITQANVGLRVLYACASDASRDRAAKEMRAIIERINYPVKVRKVKNGVRTRTEVQMNEHTICSKLKAEFEKVLPRAVVFKHADTSTISVPDISITDDRRTTWLEVKFVRAKRGAAYITSKQAQDNTHQHAMMLKLEHAAYDAWYVIVTRNGLRSFHWNLILPSELFKHDRITLQNPTPTIDYRGIVSRL